MPWIDETRCTGCMTCLKQCPADAIEHNQKTMSINDGKCIRCGQCHICCPAEAVRHDGERIPAEVANNMAWAQRIAAHSFFSDAQKVSELVERLKRYFQKQIAVAEKTIERLNELNHDDT